MSAPAGLDGLLPPEDLTPAQKRVYVRTAQGLSAKKAGEELGLSPRTVEQYRVTIRDRLGLEGSPVRAIRKHARKQLLRLT